MHDSSVGQGKVGKVGRVGGILPGVNETEVLVV